jgi:hypothetical protein
VGDRSRGRIGGGFGFAALRALVAGLLAWMILEAVHLLVRAVLLLDDRA